MYKYIIIIVIVFNYHFFYIELYIYKNKIINRYKMSSNVIEDGDNNEALLPTEKENPTKQFKKIKKIQKRTNKPKINIDTDSIYPRSIIDEDPELTSSIEFTQSNVGGLDKITRKFSHGTILHSIFTLFYNSPFITLLFFPYAFSKCGFVIGLVVLTLISLNSYFTSFLVLRIKQRTKCNSYNDLLMTYIGKKGNLVYNVIYFIFCFGMCLIYLFVFNEISKEVYYTFKGNDPGRLTQIIVLLSGYAIIGIPSFFIKQHKYVNKFKIATLVAICVSIFMLCVYSLLLEVPCRGEEFKKEKFVYKKFSLDYFTMLGIISLSLANHPFLFRNMGDLNMFTMKRGKKVFLHTTIIQFFFYIFFGIFAMFSNQFNSQNFNPLVIVIKHCQHNPPYYVNVIISCIVGLLCEFNVSHSITQFFENTKTSNDSDKNILTQLVNTDINNILYKDQIKSTTETKREEQIQLLIKIIECFFVHLVFFVINQQIDIFFGFVGGICSSALCYVIPVICYLSVDKNLKIVPKIFILFVATVMSILGLTVTTISVLQLFI